MCHKMNDLQGFLEQKTNQYNQPNFIAHDPICIPHAFTMPEDIEIAGFLTATISWGQRTTIINNARKLLKLLGNAPYQCITSASERELYTLSKHFVHRTFNGDDLQFFLLSLKNIYRYHRGLKHVFLTGYNPNISMEEALIYFRRVFFSIEYPLRTSKHVSNILKGASAKRLNMFLRWMVRNDNRGVDFGIWQEISPAHLYLPLDVHTAGSARKLKLLSRKSNDWKAVVEVTQNLQQFDKSDPVKYDFALFGLGIYENFNEHG